MLRKSGSTDAAKDKKRMEPLRPTHLVVNLTNLKKNVEAIHARVSPAKVLVMLKANAYGHGVDGVAPFIEPFVDAIGMATLDEGIHLREIGITKPILIAGGALPDHVPYFLKHNLTLTASHPAILDAAEKISADAKMPIKIHLKIDTGMERAGIREYEADKFLEQSLKLKHAVIDGIYTHFANSEVVEAKNENRKRGYSYSRDQLDRFNEVLRFYERRSLPYPLRHAANSGAIVNLRESYFDMVRPGIMFYGIYPDRDGDRSIPIQPAATWKSRVVYSKITEADRGVSYGSLWRADHPVRTITIPCGYGDGYFRTLTNKSQVIVNGKRYPQVGRICMDQMMANLESDPAEIGDEIILLGRSSSGESISADDIAAWQGTNAYEVMTNIAARVPRVYAGD